MNELNKLIEALIKEKGGTKKQYLHLLNSIANHETGGSLSHTQKQVGGGPGRGKYQFEVGKNKGGITAARRLKDYYTRNNNPIPKWLEKSTQGESLDATTLTPEQQDILYLGNMREHPRADLANVMSGKETVPDFWANYHWSGPRKHRKERIENFKGTYTPLEDINPKPFVRDTEVFGRPFATKEEAPIGMYAYGGGIDPPVKKDNVQQGKDFVTNWMTHPETRKRYRANMSGEPTTSQTNLGIDNEVFKKGFNKSLKNTTSEIKGEVPGTTGRYQNSNIEYFGNPTIGTATHEYTHATEDISNNLSKYLMKNNGPLKSLRNKYPGNTTSEAANSEFGQFNGRGAIKQAEYMGQNGELYPRIMEMRQFLNVTPGQPIDDEMINRLMQDEKTSKTARYYKPEELKEILNTVASNNQGNINNNMAAYGGSIGQALYGGSFSSYGVGGRHETNPNGGVMLGPKASVEQGETSFNFRDMGKYIFSNRITSSGVFKK